MKDKIFYFFQNTAIIKELCATGSFRFCTCLNPEIIIISFMTKQMTTIATSPVVRKKAPISCCRLFKQSNFVM